MINDDAARDSSRRAVGRLKPAPQSSALKILNALLRGFARRKPVRAGSLIVSLFGDSFSQHGNSVWLGSLIEALEPFGVNARQVRTAVFRLVRDGWLSAQRKGRRSYYSFTESGIGYYEKAARRIYASERPKWDGKWSLIVPALLNGRDRKSLRRDLRWLGYGPISPGLLAHPNAEHRSLDETLAEHDAATRVVVLDARAADPQSLRALRKLVITGWGLTQVAVRYRRFLVQFGPLLAAMNHDAGIDDRSSFHARMMLIHKYRRILLNDSELPEELLPADWPGTEARMLTAALYRVLDAGAVRHLRRWMQNSNGSFPPPGEEHYRRFGGLRRRSGVADPAARAKPGQEPAPSAVRIMTNRG